MTTSGEENRVSDALLVTVPAAAKMLAVSRSTLYAMLRSGTICSVTIGSLRRIPLSDLMDYIQRLKDQAAERGGY